MTYNLSPKIAKHFFCDLCHYKCSKQSDYNKHLLTAKHRNTDAILTNTDFNATKVASNMFKCKCGKEYKHRQSLFNHRKICKSNEHTDIELYDENQKTPEITQLITYLMNENSELKNMMMKVLENGTANNSHNTTNNSHNKAFNLQFFLNETCKDAMNIMDFVESIQLQLSDLEKVGEIGYVEGISNIIVKNLKELDVTQRPVHCTDKKRETIYIKDENKWEKDDDKNKIRKMIKRIASKNQRLLLKFKELHPDCIKYHSKYSDQYNKLIVESMGGSGNNDLEKEDKIIRNIVKNVVVDKDPGSL
jgi:hypothetical protein